MKKLAISQASLEKVVDKRQTTISNWLNGKTNPDAEDLLKLSQFFGLQMDDLLLTDLASGNLLGEDYVAKFRQFGSLKGQVIGKLSTEFNQNIGETRMANLETIHTDDPSLWALLQIMKQMAESLDRIERKLDQG